MKRKSRKPFPTVRFIMREWLLHVRSYNVGNPDKSVFTGINRIYRDALKELK